jgi:hypothetical protein
MCGESIDIFGYGVDIKYLIHHVPEYLEEHDGEVYLFCDFMCLNAYEECLKLHGLENIFKRKG